MSASPLISVIIPVYNVERYLCKCLDSVCDQTYPNLQILCVNDGSTDDSAAILEEYAEKDTRIRIITQPNAGLSAARNTGLRHATGEWVLGVDSDDYLEADTIESACSCISDEVDIIFFGIQIDWDGMPPEASVEAFYKPRGPEGANAISTELLLNMPWEFCGKLWRRSLLEKLHAQFPPGMRFEDWYFFFVYAPAARGIHLQNTQKYHYVRHAGSIMSDAQCKSPRNMEHLQVLELILKHRITTNPAIDYHRIGLSNFETAYQHASTEVPDDMQQQVQAESLRIVKQYGLADKYPGYLRFLFPQTWWQKIFVRSRFGKNIYGLGLFKPLAIQYRNGTRTTRLFGIRFCRKPY